MSIAFDTTTTSISTGFSGTVTKTWSHTCTGTNRLIVLSAGLWQDVAGTGTITAASYNGVAMTSVVNARLTGMRTEIWYLVAPASGANTVSVTVTGNTDAIKLSTSSFTGVIQAGTLGSTNTATNGVGSPPSVSLTTTTDHSLIIGVLERFSTTNATPNNFSNLANDHTTSTLFSSEYLISPAIGTYTNSYTGNSVNDLSMCIAEFLPAAVAGKVISGATSAAITASITSPGYLISVGFNTPLYLSSRGDVIWNAQTWHAYNFKINGLNVSATNPSQTGTLTIQDSDRSFTTLVLSNDIANRAVNIWKFYGEAPGSDDPVLIFSGVGDSAQINTGRGQVSVNLVLQASNKTMCPRRIISRATGFNFLPPTGTVISWNNEQFTLKGNGQ